MEAIIFCGIQITGKTSFYNKYFAKTHKLISLTNLKTRSKEKKAIVECINNKESIVIDNTNTTSKNRAEYIELLKENGYKIIGYYFESNLNDSLRRNRNRDDEDKLPDIAIRSSYKKLEIPGYREGYDELYSVLVNKEDFDILKLEDIQDVLNDENLKDKSIRQFISVVWKEQKPCFRYYDYNMEEFYDENAIGDIEMEKLNYKFCTGHYDYEDGIRKPCNYQIDLTNDNYSVCKNCDDHNEFSPCIMCKGDKCRAKNPDVLESCKNDHVLYLAYFPNDKVKVGITKFARRYERMLEQGATYSIFAAKSDGKTIRKLETEISKLGITPQVTQSYKINNLLDYKDEDSIKEVLFEKLSYIKENISKKSLDLLIEPEFNDFSYILDTIGDVIGSNGNHEKINIDIDLNYDINKEDKLKGKIVSIIGSIAILESGAKLRVINLKDLSGCLLCY